MAVKSEWVSGLREMIAQSMEASMEVRGVNGLCSEALDVLPAAWARQVCTMTVTCERDPPHNK